MTPGDVKKYYSSMLKFREVTGMSCTSLSNWFKWGFVPENSQYKLERLTKGELKVEWPINKSNNKDI